MRIAYALLILIYIGFFSLAHAQHHALDNVKIETIKLNDHLYMLRGSGGNITVLKGSGRTLMVDSQFAPLSKKIEIAIQAITAQPVTHLINTHYHGDHTSGNTHFAQQGVTIIAHDHTREILAADRKGTEPNPRLPALPDFALPYITFNDRLMLHEGVEEIELLHFPKGHTKGDIAVFFKTSNVIHTGDLYFVGVTPFIDTQHGGTYEGYLAAMKAILARANEQTQIIPGHGVLANKSMMQKDYERLQEFDPTSLD